MLLVLILLTTIFGYWYIKQKKSISYWKRTNVPHTEPNLFCGHITDSILQRAPLCDVIQKLYEKFSSNRYFGIYQFAQPVLVLRDPELIKQIGVKDFDYFPDHRQTAPENDPLWGKNLVASTGDRWRQLRPTLSPTFTSSKMKFMFSLMLECSDQFCSYFKTNEDATTEVNMKDVFTRYANDVIATTAFGVKVDSLKEQNNEFYLMGKDATDFGGVQGLKFFLYSLSPFLMKALNIKIFSAKVDKFFRSVISENIKSRLDNGIVRQDMVHLLLEARKGKIKEEETTSVDTGFATAEESSLGKRKVMQKISMTDEDITAQALIFFAAGFDTTSYLMCWMSYELAKNTDIQNKLRKEVDEVYEACNGSVTYEALVKMQYMDMVITETLRKWPPSVITDRQCVKNYTIAPEKQNETPVTLTTDCVVWIPIFSVHRDPENYPEPEKFDPERFSEENKSKIKPYTYLPFGVGPRNCIGSRFAILETKTLFFHILKNFEFTTSPKTAKDVKLNPRLFSPSPVEGFWLNLKRRNQ